MKVGFSYSRCLLDIYNNTVPLEDVLVIIARTRFNPKDQSHWDSIWKAYTVPNDYSNREWLSYENKEKEFRELTLLINSQGKLHQPRLFGAGVYRENIVWRTLS
jgi:hypothetical protein